MNEVKVLVSSANVVPTFRNGRWEFDLACGHTLVIDIFAADDESVEGMVLDGWPCPRAGCPRRCIVTELERSE